MCYRKYVCPLYRPDGEHDICTQCVYLKKAKRIVTHARIGLVIALGIFIVTTSIVW